MNKTIVKIKKILKIQYKFDLLKIWLINECLENVCLKNVFYMEKKY
jgi:hypothetical protein